MLYCVELRTALWSPNYHLVCLPLTCGMASEDPTDFTTYLLQNGGGDFDLLIPLIDQV